MTSLPERSSLTDKVPDLATPLGLLRAVVTVGGLALVTVFLLRTVEAFSPFLALAAQLAVYATARWLITGFFGGRADRVPYAHALFNRGFPAGGLVMGSLLYVLFNYGGAHEVAAERVLPTWLAGILGLYLLVTGLALMVRAFQTIGLATGLAAYNYFPDEGRLRDAGVYGRLRHPGYAGIARLALLFGLINGTAYGLLLAALFVLLWQPVWIGIEERELMERFGDGYRAYRERVPALFPSNPAAELELLRTLAEPPPTVPPAPTTEAPAT